MWHGILIPLPKPSRQLHVDCHKLLLSCIYEVFTLLTYVSLVTFLQIASLLGMDRTILLQSQDEGYWFHTVVLSFWSRQNQEMSWEMSHRLQPEEWAGFPGLSLQSTLCALVSICLAPCSTNWKACPSSSLTSSHSLCPARKAYNLCSYLIQLLLFPEISFR